MSSDIKNPPTHLLSEALAAPTVPEEFWPKKVVDPEVTDLGIEALIDLEYFAGLMARHGLPNTEIADTTFKFVAHDAIDRKEGSSAALDIAELGTYDPQTKTLEINLSSVKAVVDYMNSAEYERYKGPMSEEEYNLTASEIASDTAGHEVGHIIDRLIGAVSTDEIVAYYQGVVSINLASRALHKILSVSPRSKHRKAAEDFKYADILDAALDTDHWDDENAPQEVFANTIIEEVRRDNEDFSHPFVKITFKRAS